LEEGIGRQEEGNVESFLLGGVWAAVEATTRMAKGRIAGGTWGWVGRTRGGGARGGGQEGTEGGISPPERVREVWRMD